MTRFTSLLFDIIAASDSEMPSFTGRQTHALFLDIIGRVSPALSDKLHADTPVRPFTVSPLLGVEPGARGQIQIHEGQHLFIRFTFLDETIYAVFTDASAKLLKKKLILANAPFVLNGIQASPADSPLCLSQNAADLLRKSTPARKISIQFFSPTAFRSQGKRNVLFPLPPLVFGSWYARWQHYLDTDTVDLLPDTFDKIRVSRYALLTRVAQFGTYMETGFEGDCVFELPSAITEEEAKYLNALADFSIFCGTGAKTTMGMGQTRRI
jgi:CRISPR-associated endoribonuclease Cas6